MPGPTAPLRLTAAVVDLDRRLVFKGTDETGLTTTEDKLLRYLIARAGTVVGKDELLREVWGYREGIETRAADNAVGRLRTKIERDPKNPDHLKTVYGQGFLFEGADFHPAIQPLAAVDVARSNMVAATTETVGMAAEIEALTAALSAGGALITVVGPPGAGKTRFAHTVALGLAERPDTEVWWCDATPIRSAAQLRRLVADVIGADLRGADEDQGPDVIIAGALRARPNVLIAVDNCEQLDAEARQLFTRWRRGAPDATLLLTSREPMDTADEQLVAVPELTEEEATELFLLRAGVARAGFGIDAATREHVRVLVQQVDGLPLAIELCAAMMDMLSPMALSKRLTRTGQLPGAGGEGRHATIEVALASSWDALSDETRETLAMCAVFAGPFDLAAAEAVFQQNGDELVHLRTLAKRSLIVTVPTDDSIRYRLLASIRRFAAAHLGTSAMAIRLRHAQWFAAHFGPPGTLWSIEVAPELRHRAKEVLADIEQATQWSTERHPLLAAQLALIADRLVFQMEAPSARVPGLLTAVDDADSSGDASLQVQTRVRLCNAHGLGGNPQAAAKAVAAAQAIAMPTGDAQLIGHVQYGSGRVAVWRDELDEARADLQSARDAFADGGSPFDQAHTARWLGHAHSYQAQLEPAEKAYLEALALFRRENDHTGVAQVLGALASLDLVWGRIDAAGSRYHEALEIMTNAGYLAEVATIHGHLGNCHYESMDLDAATQAYDRAIDGHRAAGRVRFVSIVETNAASMDISRGELEGARKRLGNVLARLTEHPNGRTEGYAHSNLAVVHWLGDRPDDALAEMDLALACFDDAKDGIGASGSRLIKAGILSASGRSEEAAQALAQAEDAQARHPTPAIAAGLVAVHQMMALHRDPSDATTSDTRSVIDELRQSGAGGLYYSRILGHALQRIGQE
jgi:predicted ATPase/DNA-binding winged helix-turn-helix (wHTH) protein